VIELALANDKRWLPSFSIEVEDQAESEQTDRRCYFLKVAARAEQVAAYRRTPSRRGALVLARFRVSTRYPFGLFEKWRLIDDRAELLVYPALVPVVAPEIDAGVTADDRAVVRPGHGTEVAGLREYRDGDDARAIHWRRTAALGKLVVREREREPEWDAALEHAISRAASLADRALRRGAAVDVVARHGASPIVLPGSPPDPIFRWLARLAPIPEHAAPPLPVPRGASVVVAPEPSREAPAPKASAS
jgi:uncharacterized protein (DUF58 family)